MSAGPVDRAALIAGLFTLFAVIVGDMIAIIGTLALLGDLIPADSLHALLRGFGLLSLALPPYVAARATRARPIRHALIIGMVELLLILLLMTQTFSWQGTLQASVLGRMPLVAMGIIAVSLAAGWLARSLSGKES